jgi:hypothetical protein
MQSFNLTPRYKKRFLILVLLYVIAFTALIFDYRNLLFFSLPATLIIVLGVVRAVYWTTKESLRLFDEFIVYSAYGITIQVSWKQIESIQKMFVWHNWTWQECLVIDRSSVKILSSSAFALFISPPAKISNLQKEIIPLSSFAKDWRNSELGQKIQQRAPHLFQ